MRKERGIFMEITSGFTKEFSEHLPQWYGQEELPRELGGWDELMEEPDTGRLLTRLRPIPFYRYILRYLIGMHGRDLEGFAAGNGLDVSGPRWQEEYARQTFREIQDNPKRKPFLREVAVLLMRDFASNGCAPAGKGDTVYGSLTEEVLWNLDAVRKTLSARTVPESKFFVLAVGLNMSLEDTELFLRKVLLRAGLDPRDPEELLLYLTLRYARENRRGFYGKARKALTAATAKKPETAGGGTMVCRDLADRVAEELSRLGAEPDPEHPDFRQFFGVYKGMLREEAALHRSGVNRFLSLVSRFKDICGAEIADQSLSLYAQKEYAEGELEIFFTPGGELTIPRGTVFEGKARGRDHACQVLRDTEPELPRYGELVVPVTYVGQADGTVPAHTAFACSVAGVVEAENHSKFKTNKGSTAISGKLFLKCQWGTCIPEGTLFSQGGQSYAATETVEARPSVRVPVRSLRSDEDIPRDVLTGTRGQFPGKDAITGISHSKFLCNREEKAQEKKESQLKKSRQPESDGCPDLRLCAYLYAPAQGKNFCGSRAGGRNASTVLGLESREAPMDYGRALGEILEGTALTPTRFTLLRKQEGVTVKRHELLTMAFLVEMYNAEFVWDLEEDEDQWAQSCWERISGVLQRVNEILREHSFHEVYLPNPYDCLLVYLFTCSEPLSAFRNLWGIYLDYKIQETEVTGK